MTTEQNKINARRIVEEAWNKHNTKPIDELFSNDATLHNPQDPTIGKGPQGAKTSLQTYLTAFPDVKLTIEALFVPANVEALGEALVDEFAKWDAAELLPRMLAEDVPCGPVKTIEPRPAGYV